MTDRIEVTDGVVAELNWQIEMFRMRCLQLAKEKEDVVNALHAMREDMLKDGNGDGDSESGT